MDPAALHEHLAGLPPAMLVAPGSLGAPDDATEAAPLADIEAHVAAGCSRCARALVNARELSVTLAESTARAEPRPGLRDRLLASASAGADLRARARSGASAARRGTAPRRYFDPAGEVARLHRDAAGDADRVRRLGALSFPASAAEAAGKLLEALEQAIAFPLLFVSIVRGERVGYLAQRGLGVFASTTTDRRREITFCTHTVSLGAPLVIPDTAAEPFFRGSSMVLRDGIGAYVGVPVSASGGVTVGTVCAMDFVPRRISPEVVRAVEACAAAVAAAIEG